MGSVIYEFLKILKISIFSTKKSSLFDKKDWFIKNILNKLINLNMFNDIGFRGNMKRIELF